VINTQIQELNVYAIVFHNDKILVLKRPNDLWEFAGGSVDFGEQPLQAAYREFKEETSLIAKDLSLIGVASAVYPKEGNEKHAIYLIYRGTVDNDRVIISSEHKEARWVTAYELKFLKLALNAEAALEFLQ